MKKITIPIVDTAKNGTGKTVDVITITPHKVNPRPNLNSDELNYIIQNHLSFFQQASYDLLLSATDRIMTCEEYLVGNKVNSLSEIEIITYFSVIAMLFDALKYTHNSIWAINHPNTKNNDVNGFIKTTKTIFNQTATNLKPIIKKACGKDIKDNVRDDQIMKFLRSLMFAHSIETTRAGFLENNIELALYSPWAFSYNKAVVLKIYFNGQMEDLYVPFSEIEAYAHFLIGKIAELKVEIEKESEKDKETI